MLAKINEESELDQSAIYAKLAENEGTIIQMHPNHIFTTKNLLQKYRYLGCYDNNGNPHDKDEYDQKRRERTMLSKLDTRGFIAPMMRSLQTLIEGSFCRKNT